MLRQLNNKIVTNFVSMSMISFLLFLSVSISLSIFTYRSNLEKSLEGNLNFDASGTVSIYNPEDREKDLRELINQNKSGLVLDEKTQFAVYKKHSLNTSMEEILGNSLTKQQRAQINLFMVRLISQEKRMHLLFLSIIKYVHYLVMNQSHF